jgi:diadenosine tetraphosphate (Ap4A) HIT family hydrolase
MADECPFCAANETPVDELPARERAHVGEHWRVTVNASALPGWLLVILRRHVETLAELEPAEAAELGGILAEGTRALGETVGAVKSYAMLFAEATKHAHFSLVPRMADIPDRFKGANVQGYNQEGTPISEAERDAIAERIAAVWHASAG